MDMLSTSLVRTVVSAIRLSALQLRCCAGVHSRHFSSEHDEPRRPKGLEGNNWRDYRKKSKLGNDKWRPTKRLTWHQMDHLRTLRSTQPEEWTKAKLARSFGISILAVNRILRSKFVPTEEIKERQDARARERKIASRLKEKPRTGIL